MKKLLILLSLVLFISCEQYSSISSDEVMITLGIKMPETTRSVSFNNPYISYTIEKDGFRFSDGADYSPVYANGEFLISISLMKGFTYTFSQFDIRESGNTLCSLDNNHPANIAGFSVSKDGIITPNPVQVHLIHQTAPVYTDRDLTPSPFEVITHFKNSAEDLTFMVTLGQGIELEIWYFNELSELIQVPLSSGQIFDMDTCALYDPAVPGDGIIDAKYSRITFCITKSSDRHSMFIKLDTDQYNRQNLNFSF